MVRRTLREWLEIAIWPGVSSDHVGDELLMRSRTHGDHLHDPDLDSDRAVVLVSVRPERAELGSVVSSSRAGAPVVTGTGHTDLVCSRCGFSVCRRIGAPERFVGLLFECPGCTDLQRMDTAWP